MQKARAVEARRERGERQSPSHDAQERQRSEDVDGEVERMIPPDAAAQAVIKRESELRDRPDRRKQRPDRPQVLRGRLVHKRLVIENEWAAEAVAVGGQACDDDRRNCIPPYRPPRRPSDKVRAAGCVERHGAGKRRLRFRLSVLRSKAVGSRRGGDASFLTHGWVIGIVRPRRGVVKATSQTLLFGPAGVLLYPSGAATGISLRVHDHGDAFAR
jgi:hypothetical protein